MPSSHKPCDDTPDSAKFQALLREATSAAEHLGVGATTLGRANYARSAYYAQAFFALSIGFERAGKLILLLDYAIDHQGEYPGADVLRSYGHDLRRLFELTEAVAQSRQISVQRPRSSIHEGIIETLNEFATNLTRYYNLELLAGDARTISRDDPLAAWHERVTEPVLATHDTIRARERRESKARLVDDLLGEHSSVRHHAESGAPITDVYNAALLSAATDFAKPWERMYVLQLVRFMSHVLIDVGGLASRVAQIPHFVEIFGVFLNDDSMFRSRKVWSTYPV